MGYFNLAFTVGAARQPTTLAPGLVVAAAACISAATLLWRHARSHSTLLHAPSPNKTVVPTLSEPQLRSLPYPPDALPGGRDVDTPYGSIRVYEWGPEHGERILFVHGISTPSVALGDLGHEMAGRGYRVMMFDLFGRGYSDAPCGLAYDTRLYVTQLLLVLASSASPWAAAPGFHLVGYSMGGALSVAFARYFPHLVRSLCLIAPCGLIRRRHVGWRSWLYYDSGVLPECLVTYLVRRRIRPRTGPARSVAEGGRIVNGDADANGGAGFDGAAISKAKPEVTVSSVVAWQVDHHEGFVMAFLSTIRNAPIYAPQEDWTALSSILQARRPRGGAPTNDTGLGAGLKHGKILIVLGKDDGVIVMAETVEDVNTVLGPDGAKCVVLEGGHELPITSSVDVAESIEAFLQEL
ncbi:putative alpha beta-hydrolase [Rosellinia necatrix]|uniref:Putative alpha beta-hydrolase n=1 Tax=Rosellinia necatrix TaxID=77044 RepID=A0A1W2TTX0_ROSNE|nr:putative alpha beta-hydrolase [Rosellinia necatrix]